MIKFTVILCAAALLLCSCGMTPGETVKSSLCIPLEAEFACGETRMHAFIDAGNWKISYSAPEALRGLELRGGEGGRCELSLDGFVRAARVEAFPAAKLLVQAVHAANGTGKTVYEQAGICAYTIDETDIMVYYDTESGSVTSLTAAKDGTVFEYTVIR